MNALSSPLTLYIQNSAAEKEKTLSPPQPPLTFLVIG